MNNASLVYNQVDMTIGACPCPLTAIIKLFAVNWHWIIDKQGRHKAQKVKCQTLSKLQFVLSGGWIYKSIHYLPREKDLTLSILTHRYFNKLMDVFSWPFNDFDVVRCEVWGNITRLTATISPPSAALTAVSCPNYPRQCEGGSLIDH